jgi:hypothetical protein
MRSESRDWALQDGSHIEKKRKKEGRKRPEK